MSQIPLGLVLRERSTFDTYYPRGNEEVLAYLRDFAGGQGQVAWLAGPWQSGKTHLMGACCLLAADAGRQAAYLAMGQLEALEPAVLEGWEQHALLCLDDLDQVIGKPEWERALFILFNQLRERGGQMLVAAAGGPRAYQFALADLQSRLSWGGVFELRALDEPGRIAALRLRARDRGMDLPEDTGSYLLQRIPRDLGSLFDFLDTLDHESLAAQRKLTVPFVREVLEKRAGTRRPAG